MGFSIQTNVNSLVAQENLRVTNDFQAKTIARLTSGYRITASGDDAAGLAVANKFRSDVAELAQGVRNANDGLSQLQIVDGGLNNISKMVDRLKTLATQSASTTFTGNRTTLNNEYQALLKEIDRQAANVGLVQGGTYNKVIDVYIGGGGTTQSNSKVSVDLSSSANQVDSTGLGLNTTNVAASGTGLTTNAVRLDNVAGTFTGLSTFVFDAYLSSGRQQFTITYDGTGVTTGQGAVDKLNGSLSTYGITASIGSNGMLQLASGNAFSVSGTAAASSIITTGSTANNNAGMYAFVGTGTGPTSGSETVSISNGQGSATVTIVTGTTMANLVSQLNGSLASLGIYAVSDSAGTHVTLQSATTFTINETVTDTATVKTGWFGTATGSIALTNSSPTNVGAAALSSLTALTTAVGQLGLVQGRVGTGQNKLATAISLAQSQMNNFSAADSRIRDADVAAEAANLTKAQVLIQAGVAAMAQANSAPQAVLALLRG